MVSNRGPTLLEAAAARHHPRRRPTAAAPACRSRLPGSLLAGLRCYHPMEAIPQDRRAGAKPVRARRGKKKDPGAADEPSAGEQQLLVTKLSHRDVLAAEFFPSLDSLVRSGAERLPFPGVDVARPPAGVPGAGVPPAAQNLAENRSCSALPHLLFPTVLPGPAGVLPLYHQRAGGPPAVLVAAAGDAARAGEPGRGGQPVGAREGEPPLLLLARGAGDEGGGLPGWHLPAAADPRTHAV